MKIEEINNYDKISVVVPIYRVEPYLRKCLDSIVSQTYKNLEIILVNDGSDDGCPAICEEYAQKDNRIILIHKKNGGLSDARNVGIEKASGKYLAFVDSDDWITSDMFETLYHKAILYNADITICGHYIEKNNKIHIPYCTYEDILYEMEEALLDLIEDIKINSYAWGKLYKKELFNEIRFPVGYNYEDLAIMYRLFLSSKVILRIREMGYYYVYRSCGISNQKNFKNYYDKWFAFHNRYLALSNLLPHKKYELYRTAVLEALKTYVFWIIEEPNHNHYNLLAIIRSYRKDPMSHLVVHFSKFIILLLILSDR